MKRILKTAIFCIPVIMLACNDAGESSATDTDSDSAAATAEATPAVSNVVSQHIMLGADQEVPANSSTATGTADVTFNKDSKVLSYTISYSGLTDKPTMAHIHGTAPKGANAGVKRDLTSVLQKEVSGSFTDSVKIDASDINEDSLITGFYYFNIHTPKNPGGEIRGQISF